MYDITPHKIIPILQMRNFGIAKLNDLAKTTQVAITYSLALNMMQIAYHTLNG